MLLLTHQAEDIENLLNAPVKGFRQIARAEPQNPITDAFKPSIPPGVARQPFRGEMMLAVDFDNKFPLMDSEVHDIGADWRLLAEMEAIRSKVKKQPP